MVVKRGQRHWGLTYRTDTGLTLPQTDAAWEMGRGQKTRSSSSPRIGTSPGTPRLPRPHLLAGTRRGRHARALGGSNSALAQGGLSLAMFHSNNRALFTFHWTSKAKLLLFQVTTHTHNFKKKTFSFANHYDLKWYCILTGTFFQVGSLIFLNYLMSSFLDTFMETIFSTTIRHSLEMQINSLSPLICSHLNQYSDLVWI